MSDEERRAFSVYLHREKKNRGYKGKDISMAEMSEILKEFRGEEE